MNSYIVTAALILGSAVALEGRQRPQVATTYPSRASATLIDGMGRAVGQARLRQTPHGVLLHLDLTNATPGVHAVHIHETGRCEAPTFESAGSHFAPDGRIHGFLNPDGPHAGDLANVYVPASLALSVVYVIDDVTLTPGPRSLLDDDGSAIVMHAGADDYKSQPAGNAGERLACGDIIGRSAD